MRRRSKISIPSKIILIFLSIACIVLIVLSYFSDSFGKPVKTAAGYVLVPIQSGMNDVGLWFSNKADNLKQLKDVMDENKELQAKVDELTVENSILTQDKSELERLRQLFELDQTYSDYTKIAARVIAKDPGNWFQVFQIDKGSNDGIAVDMNVISGGGLVGIVIQVGPNYAVVRSIIDDASNVSAQFSSTADNCIVEGDLKLMNDGVIKVDEISKNADVKEGDTIITSHISDKYLPGILIGYVKNVNTDSNNLTKSGYVTPIVDFEHLEEVLVIKELKVTGK